MSCPECASRKRQKYVLLGAVAMVALLLAIFGGGPKPVDAPSISTGGP